MGQASQRARSGAEQKPLTNLDVRGRVFPWTWLGVPFLMVVGWYLIWALGLPPHGPWGRWAAFGLTALLGPGAFWMWCLLGMGLAMDGSPRPREIARHPFLEALWTAGLAIGMEALAVFPVLACIAVLEWIF